MTARGCSRRPPPPGKELLRWCPTLSRPHASLHYVVLSLVSHPQKLKPEYSKAATTLNEHDATIVIGKVRPNWGGEAFDHSVAGATLLTVSQTRERALLHGLPSPEHGSP